MSLDVEIAAYKKLLDSEETRYAGYVIIERYGNNNGLRVI